MLDLPVNILTGLRYQKDPATTMIGPIFGSMSELLGSAVELSGDRNSPNTNTAERKLARNIYSTVVVPAMSAAFSTRSEEHTSELQSLMRISYAVFCLKKKTKKTNTNTTSNKTKKH